MGLAVPSAEPVVASEGASQRPSELSRSAAASTAQASASSVLLAVSLTGLVNLALFALIGSSGRYRSSASELQPLFVFFSTAFTVVCSALALRAWAPSAQAEVRRGYLGIHATRVAVVVVGLGAVLYQLVMAPGVLLAQPLYDSLLLVIAVLAVQDRVAAVLRARLQRSTSFHVRELVPTARVVEGQVGTAGGEVTERIIAAELVTEGALVRVRNGEYLPVDGVVEAGIAELLERRYCPVGAPRVVSTGQQVCAGSLVRSGQIDLRATSPQVDALGTTYEDHVDRQVASDPSRSETDRWRMLYGVALVFCAAILALWLQTQGGSVFTIVSVVSSVLLISIVPVALELESQLLGTAVARAFRLGALFRGAQILPRLAALSSLLWDRPSGTLPGRAQVLGVELLDNRFDRNALLSAVYALLSRSEGETESVVREYVRKRLSQVQLVAPVDVRSYGMRGISGTIEGVDMTIGEESLLIERGVQMQPSDLRVATDRSSYLYVSVEDDVVACFQLAPAFVVDGQAAIQALRPLGVRPMLRSGRSLEPVSSLAKSAGLDGNDVLSEATQEQTVQRFESLRPVGVVLERESGRELQLASDVTLTTFDDLLCEIDRADVTLFRSDLALIPELVKLSRLAGSVRLVNRCFAGGLTALLLLCSIFGAVAPVVVAIACLLAVTFVHLHALFLVRQQ